MERFEITEGTDVYGADGDKVGSVIAVQPGYVVVEKGFFFPTDYYIPTSAISSMDDGKVYLNVTKDQARNQGWDSEPAGDLTTGDDAADMGGVATTASNVGYGSDLSRSDAGTVDTGSATTRVAEDDTLRVQVREEELTATTREREIGRVRIEKDVVAEERVLDVPVTEERVTVQRRVVDRAVGADDAAAFEEGVIEVPIRGEEVQVQKQTRVAEEIEIGKEAVQRTERVADTVRREEVRITEDVIDPTGAADTGRGRDPGR